MIATAKTAAARQGELFRDEGVMLATLNRRELIDRDELRFLDALTVSGQGTTDDGVDDLFGKFDDGGKWRGSIPLRLAREGLIERTGVTRSARSHRHCGWLAVWSIRNRPAVDARRFVLRTMTAAMDAARNGTGPTMPVVEPVESSITHTTTGVNEHGQAQ